MRQPVSATADAIINMMAAAGETIISAGRFVVGGAIMSNPVQDARRELKITICFVGTVAHLHLINIDGPHDSGSPAAAISCLVYWPLLLSARFNQNNQEWGRL